MAQFKQDQKLYNIKLDTEAGAGHHRGSTMIWAHLGFFFLDWKIKSIRYLGEMILLFSPYHVTLWTHHRFVAGISI